MDDLLQKRMQTIKNLCRRKEVSKSMKKRWFSLMLVLCMIVSVLPVQAKTGLSIRYYNKDYTYTNKQLKVKYNGKNIDITKTPGLIMENGIGLLPYYDVFTKTLGVSCTYNKNNRTIVFKQGSKEIVLYVNKTKATINGKSAVSPIAPRFVRFKSVDKVKLMVPSRFVAENLGYHYDYNSSTGTISITGENKTETPSKNETTQTPNTNTKNEEIRAMWVSYLEFGSEKKTKAQWQSLIDKIFDDCVAYGMNTIMFQVRPFGDAMYESDIFPWSKYISGTQGSNPGYDPFAYAVKAAHNRGLKIEAWINPYRVASGTTDVTKLSKDNPARKFRATKGKERYVLSYGGNLYYNPAVKEVRDLIVDGVKEIVEKYDVDGIHMDDYFYPSLGSGYKTNFDATEYNKSGSSLSIADWRRENVNKLVKALYDTVKEEDNALKFGISPAGNPSNLTDNTMYYTDIDTWMNKKGYLDYICPQIYWSFDHKVAPYDEMVDKWVKLNKANIVDLYIGIPVYKAGAPSVDSGQWKNKTTILRDQIVYARNTKAVDGFAFFSYGSFQRTVAQKEVANLVKVLK